MTTKGQHNTRLTTAEVRCLYTVVGKTRMDLVRNQESRLTVTILSTVLQANNVRASDRGKVAEFAELST